MVRNNDNGEAPPSGEVNITSDGPAKERLDKRPDISSLEDALERRSDGRLVPRFGPGEKIVIERRSSVLEGNPWLDTQTYVVREIEPDSGVLRLWNPNLHQQALSNFVTGTEIGCVFKLASIRGGSIGKKKRGRPRRDVTGPAPAAVEPPKDGEKKKRGRPKGVKNRSKEVIVAEKAARSAERTAKRNKL